MPLNVEDAMSYLDKVKARFQGQGAIYSRFLEVMRDFKSQEIDTETVIQRVTELFRDEEDLIVGFNSFIPQGYRIDAPPLNAYTQSLAGVPDDDNSGNCNITNFTECVDNQSSVSQQNPSFNHAFQYVNKVKNRFLADAEIYRKFLDILHWYQKEQRNSDPSKRRIAEQRVYQDVAKLFDGHNDLLQEFNQFLPESSFLTSSVGFADSLSKKQAPMGLAGSNLRRPYSAANPDKKLKRLAPAQTGESVAALGLASTPKKPRSGNQRDVSLADINQIGRSNDISVLFKIQEALNSSGSTRAYQQVLSNVLLFNQGLISSDDMLEAVKPVLVQHMELWRNLRDIVLPYSSKRGYLLEGEQLGGRGRAAASMKALVNEVQQRRHDLNYGQLAAEGTSYRALPAGHPQPKCSGRLKDRIAQEVLNDTYIGFSSLTSEDSQFVSSKKNPFEESMYRVEDERYEVDMVMELNRSAMQNLLAVRRRLDGMSREEQQAFKLGDALGGSSAILMKKAVHRVYGDKAAEVIYGLQTNPKGVVPIVIARMCQKDEEWRDSVRHFQRSWSEQDSKNYLRSLDHQGANFKQKDIPLIKCKHFISQIEAIASRNSSSSCRADSDPISSLIAASMQIPVPRCHAITPLSVDVCGGVGVSWNNEHIGTVNFNVVEGTGKTGGPHVTMRFPEPRRFAALMEDATSLVIHHVKRQSNTNKEDKRAMKLLMRTVVQDIFGHERIPMSDDDEEEALIDGDEDRSAPATARHNGRPLEELPPADQCNPDPTPSTLPSPHDSSTLQPVEEAIGNTGLQVAPEVPGEEYFTVFYTNNQWYGFLRLLHLLLTRLHQLRTRGDLLSLEHQREQSSNLQAAVILKLRRANAIEPHKYYKHALHLVKDLLDGAEDIATYEDRLRDMFGIYAFPWFTMDRLVANIVKQLSVVACSDELSAKLTALFKQWNNLDRPPSKQPPKSTLPYGGVSGPLRTRMFRLSNEASYALQCAEACLDEVREGDSGAESKPNATPTQKQESVSGSEALQPPDLYALVFVKQASLLLTKIMEPVQATSVSSADLSPWATMRARVQAEQKTARAFDAYAGEATNEPARNWSEFLARYFGHSAGYPVRGSAAFAARLNPVFMVRTVLGGVRGLAQQAMRRKRQEMLDTGHEQPIERAAAQLRAGEESGSDQQEEAWNLLSSAFKCALTRQEVFRDTYSSDCMQSTRASSTSTGPSKGYKITWSVGSYGIFFRRRHSKQQSALDACKRRSPAKFHQLVDRFLHEHGQQSTDPFASQSESAQCSMKIEEEELEEEEEEETAAMVGDESAQVPENDEARKAVAHPELTVEDSDASEGQDANAVEQDDCKPDVPTVATGSEAEDV